MAYPDPPSISFDYSAFERSLGDGTFPGEEMDIDLAAFQQSITEITTFLQRFTRSDGRLANGSVTRDTLGTDVRLGFDAPTVWAAGTAYSTTSSVFFGTKFFIATTAHTASSDFASDLASGRWVELADFTPSGAALVKTNNLSDIPDSATARANLGLGSVATENTVPIAKGGTGAVNAAAARTALGLAVGTDVQAHSAILAALAGLTSAANKLPYFDDANSMALFDLPSSSRTRIASGLGSAATRNAEDTLTNGSNLPDGAAVKAYVDEDIVKTVAFGVVSDGNFAVEVDEGCVITRVNTGLYRCTFSASQTGYAVFATLLRSSGSQDWNIYARSRNPSSVDIEITDGSVGADSPFFVIVQRAR